MSRKKAILKTFLYIVVVTVAGVAIGNFLVQSVWRVQSEYRLRNKTSSDKPAISRSLLWHDPGNVSALDFSSGPGGKEHIPAPPFDFIKEHTTASSPSVSVKDSKGRTWRLKWGEEVRSEAFATRMAWAAGYFVEASHFVPEGRISGATNLQNASVYIDQNQLFHDARFELEEPEVVKGFDEESWAWNDNPFVGTPELAGLKIMMMLTSNWDNKDIRDVSRGSNNAIFYHKTPKGPTEARYMVMDWGGSMGRWGNVVTRSKWDPVGFLEQTTDFAVLTGNRITWGYTGQRTEDITEGISTGDVRWLYQYIGKITDAQLEKGLTASGATNDEKASFVRAIRERINQLQTIAENQH